MYVFPKNQFHFERHLSWHLKVNRKWVTKWSQTRIEYIYQFLHEREREIIPMRLIEFSNMVIEKKKEIRIMTNTRYRQSKMPTTCEVEKCWNETLLSHRQIFRQIVPNHFTRKIFTLFSSTEMMKRENLELVVKITENQDTDDRKFFSSKIMEMICQQDNQLFYQ